MPTIAFVAVNVSVAQTVAVRETEARAHLLEEGQELASSAESDCVFSSRCGYPSIELASGCVGYRAFDPLAATNRFDDIDDDVDGFLIWANRLQPEDDMPPGWTPWRAVRSWTILRPS